MYYIKNITICVNFCSITTLSYQYLWKLNYDNYD